MNRECFQRVKSVFLQAGGLPSTRRSVFLREACGSDAEMQGAVDAMLSGDARPLERLEEVVRAPLEQLWCNALSDDQAVDEFSGACPEHIGPFRIVRRIGEGGMGAVFEARQEHPQRTVALKLLRGVMADSGLMRRFRQEVELLGRCHHPGIAQIHEAGTAEIAGATLPYFAMEFVQGGTVSEYVDRNQLGTRQRLHLMARLCDAVQHAHQHGIIHRDLKPANILVDESVGGGQPKILDFGVARAIESDVRMTTAHTGAGQLIGTLRYMSPEQASGDRSAIDARSDVYALGVILYELLTGQAPYDVDHRTVPDAVRVIREVDPKRPSSVAGPGIAARSFRGDIETIVLKALEKDARHRYQSARELGEDLRRYLANEPILARPASRTYQLRKFAARHRGLVAGLTFTTAALLAGTVVSTSLYVSARTARDKAQFALSESEEVTTLLSDLLLSVTPESRVDGTFMTELLDRAAGEIGDRFADRPMIEARLCDTIGQAYLSLLEPEAAAPLIERALQIRCGQLGPRHPETAMSLQHAAELALARGLWEEAERLAAQAIDIQTELCGTEQDPTLRSLELRAEALRVAGKDAEALEILRATYQIRLRVDGPDDPKAIHAMGRYAAALCGVSLPVEAEQLYQAILDVHGRVSISEKSKALGNLGMIYRQTGRFEEAADAFAQNEALLKRYVSEDHISVLKNCTEVGVLHLRQQRLNEADRILTEVLARCRRALGERNAHTLWTAYCLIETLMARGEHERALPVAERAVLETDRLAPGFLELLACVHRGLGQTVEAATLEEAAAVLPNQGSHPWQRHHPPACQD